MNIALIIGCARSGTSILGELLAAHPDVRYVFEAHSVWECAGPGINQSSRLTAQDAKPGVISQIREFFSSEGASSKLVVEKNPRNALRVPYIRAVFPEAKIIHIVRDGRDVACSMRPGCGGEEWRHLKPPDWQELFSRYSGALRCALAWRSVLEIALADLRDVPHIQVRYEDLVADPVSVSRLLLEYVGLPIVPEVADFCKHIQDSTADSYHAANQSRWYRADHARRIGRWQENLSEDEIQAITEALEPMLVTLGYLDPKAGVPEGTSISAAGTTGH